MKIEIRKAFNAATYYFRKLERDAGVEVCGKYADAMDAYAEAVDSQPEIIRCKDCIYASILSNRLWCNNFSKLIEDDGFCSYAKSREEPACINKVIKGLECCKETEIDTCPYCPYNHDDEYGENACLREKLLPDAIKLLKEQQKIVEEINSQIKKDGYQSN